MTNPTSFRFSDMTSRQLERLVETTGNTRTGVVSMAIDRMYQQERYSMDPNTYDVVERESLHEFDGAALEMWTIDEEGVEYKVAVMHYHDTGILFTTGDWQSQQPQSVDEIPSYGWVDQDGRDAIMLEGLPVRNFE